MKIDWNTIARKLSSRKFWALLAALAVSVCTALGVIPATTENITAIIGALGACAVYMLSEAYVDGKNAGSGGGDNEH